MTPHGVSADAIATDLARAPGYLVKVPCTHEPFLEIGSAVADWDDERGHVRVCVYLGLKQPIAVVSMYPSATPATIAALQDLLSRWGASSVAKVANAGENPLTA